MRHQQWLEGGPKHGTYQIKKFFFLLFYAKSRVLSHVRNEACLNKLLWDAENLVNLRGFELGSPILITVGAKKS